MATSRLLIVTVRHFNLTRCRSLESFSSSNSPTEMKTRGGVINNTAAQTQTEPPPPEDPMAQSSRARPQICTSALEKIQMTLTVCVKIKTDGKLNVNWRAYLSSFPFIPYIFLDFACPHRDPSKQPEFDSFLNGSDFTP